MKTKVIAKKQTVLFMDLDLGDIFTWGMGQDWYMTTESSFINLTDMSVSDLDYVDAEVQLTIAKTCEFHIFA